MLTEESENLYGPFQPKPCCDSVVILWGFWGDFVVILGDSVLPPAPPEAPAPWLEGPCSPRQQFPVQGAKPPALSTHTGPISAV